ncbi:MAG: hydrogenase maturation protease [Candidatus Solibacter sp.]|nr:hydrogenase maturation protease [Candidatus Solibacter sp.]
MPHTLIVGYGNVLRGDDGAGFLVAELLRERIRDPEIQILSQQQLLPELMEPISRVARVIFIDASVSGRAGKFQRIPLRPAPACARFTHHATPESLLAGAQSLYGHTPEATLYTIPGRFFETGEELTPSVRRAVNELAATLEVELAVRPSRGA